MDKSLLIFQLKTQWRIYSFNDKWTSDSDIHLLKIEWLNLKFYNYLISISCKRAVVGSNTTKSIYFWRYSQVGRRRWTANPLFAGSNPAIVFLSCGHGGIGRHIGLKIWCSLERGSSSLSTYILQINAKFILSLKVK